MLVVIRLLYPLDVDRQMGQFNDLPKCTLRTARRNTTRDQALRAGHETVQVEVAVGSRGGWGRLLLPTPPRASRRGLRGGLLVVHVAEDLRSAHEVTKPSTGKGSIVQRRHDTALPDGEERRRHE